MGELYILIGMVLEILAILKPASEAFTDIYRLSYFICGAVFLVGGTIIRRMK